MTTSEHPEELLADYVDGELGADARAEVEAHLARCGRCRDEVAVATEAVRSLSEVGDQEPPPGTTSWVLRQAGRRRRVAAPVVWAGAGVAAAVVAGALFFSGLAGQEDAGSGEGSDAPQARSAAEGAPSPGAAFDAAPAVAGYPLYLRTQTDHDTASVQRRARELGREAEAAIAGGFPDSAQEFYEQVDLGKLEDPAAQALRCATSGAPPERTVVPFVLEEARFEGIAAYLVSFLQGPEAGEPFDQVQILVVEREGCTVRHFALQRL